MDATQFAQRMAAARARFADKIAAKIDETDAALSTLSAEGPIAAGAVAEIYRRFHDLSGIGPIVGFDASGRAARCLVDNVLVEPFRNERGLTIDEVAKLKEGLSAFRLAASVDMQSTDTKYLNVS